MLGQNNVENEIGYMTSPATLSGLRNYHDVASIPGLTLKRPPYRKMADSRAPRWVL